MPASEKRQGTLSTPRSNCLATANRAAPARRSPRPRRPVYSWFTEGFDTADLKEAKALLDQYSCLLPGKAAWQQ
jgi:hypothetical protein